MYHLFDSVYVDTHSRIDRTQDVITIGNQLGYEYFPDERAVVGKQLAYAESLDDVTPEAFVEMFTLAKASKKATVFGCGHTYLRLYTLLVKALLPNVDIETFKWIMLCKKATFNTTLTNIRKPVVDVIGSVTITGKVIEELYAFEDPLLPAMQEVILQDKTTLSLEWRILRLKTDQRVGLLPKVLKRILHRIALANTHDALDVWGRVLTEPENWEFGGCDFDSLLNAPTVFEGSMALQFSNNPMFLQPNLFDQEPSDDWIKGLLSELIPMLAHCDEGPTAGRTKLILKLLQEQVNLYNPEACLERVMTMFHGPKRLALPNRDSGKYDENLIRYILRTDVSALKACVEGAEW